MKSMFIYVWTMILVALVASYGFYTLWRVQAKFQPVESQVKVDYVKLAREHHLRGNEFVLTDQNGDLFLSNSLRGKVWLMSFFFSTCNEECLQMNKVLAELQKEEIANEVEFVSVTCSPEYDDPPVLKKYSQRYQASDRRWHFLTGDYLYIKNNVVGELPIAYERNKHGMSAVLFDKNGKVRSYINLLNPGKVEELKELIGELKSEHFKPDSSNTDAPLTTNSFSNDQ